MTGTSNQAYEVSRYALSPVTREAFFKRVENEIGHAYAKHGSASWGRHEFYAILKEEVDELWDAIKQDKAQSEVHRELIQVAAMCLRYFETGDRYRV